MRTGLDRILAEVPADLRGARVGLLTHAAGVGVNGENAADLLRACPQLELVRLFAPEHGLRGDRPAGEAVVDGLDGPTGLRVVSLYGRSAGTGPVPFAGLDAVLADLQDIGTRYFTYAGTLRRLIARAAAAGVPVWVLDRPNPLGGGCAGPAAVAPALRSLVGSFDVPVRHGLTIGELALLGAREDGLPDGAVRVLQMEGWRRAQAFSSWGRSWVPPSPNATGPEMAELYPGTCLFEGTNLSEGRGTPYPFRQIGAPWVDAPALAARLRPLLRSGVRARPVWFLPTASKHVGTVCGGVFLDLEPGVARAHDAGLAAGVHLLSLLAEDAHFELLAHGGVHGIDRLSGGDALRRCLGRPQAVGGLLAEWRAEAGGFEARRPVSLYG